MKRKVSVVLSAAMAATTIMAQGVPAYAAPEIRPYGNVEAELDFDHSYQGTVTDEHDVTSVNLESGDYFSTHSVNFSQGVSKITLKIKGTGAGIIELRKGDKDGDKIGNVKYTATDEFKEYDLSVSGIDDLDAIAFVNVAGSCLVDSWTAEPGSTVDEPDQPDTPDQPDVPDQPDTPDQPEIPDVPDVPDQPQIGTVNPYGRVEAEDFADSLNAKVVPNKESVLISDGGYIIAKNVDFSKGLSEVKVYAKSTQPMVKLGVYVDGTDTLLGEINIGTDMTSATALDVTSALSGKHNVYFKAKGGSVQLDAWEVSEGSGTVEQPPVEEPPVSGGVNPYDTVVAKDHVDEKKDAMVTPMGATVNILSEGGYFAVKDVNLSKGISSFTVKAGATVASVFEIRLDKVEGDKLAAFKVSTESKEIKINALSDVSGKHTLYFVATKGKGINIDSWKAEAGQGTVVTPPVEEPPVSGGINPYETVEVEKVSSSEANRSKGNTIVAPKNNAITLMNEGAYVIAKDVNFTSGVSEFTISTATKTSGLLEIRLDSVTGTNIASVRLDKTDDAFKTPTVKVNSTVTGKHDVYFVLKMGTGCTLDSWKATAASGTVVTPPEEEQPVEPPVSGGVNPYVRTEAEANDANNFTNAFLAPAGGKSVVINDGGYILIKDLDFSKGLSGFKVYAQTKQPKVKLNVYIDDSLEPAGTVAVGADMTQAADLNISADLTGKHYIYFEAKGGPVTLDAWQAVEKSGTVVTPPVEEPPVGNTVNPYEKNEAEAAAELSDAMIAPNKQNVVIKKGGYVVVKNVDFSKGLSALTVKVQGLEASRLEARLDKLDAKAFAMFMVGTGANELNFNTSASITGTHDIYFVDTMDGSISFDYWQAKAADGTVVTPPVEEPPVGDTVDPYNTVQAEESAELSDAMLSPDKQSVVIRADGFMLAKNVDFSKGIAGIFVSAKSSAPKTAIEVYIDTVKGTPIASLNVTSMSDFSEIGAKLSSNLTGKHDVYFVAKGNVATVDSWHAMAAGGTVVTPPVGNTVNPYEKNEAEAASELSSARISPNKQNVVIDKGGYVVVKNVDFSKGLSALTVKVQGSAASRLEARLDAPDAKAFAMFMVGTGANELNFNTSASITGTHDIYFVDTMDGSISFDYWQAKAADGTVEQPPVSGTVNPYQKVEAEDSAELSSALLAPNKQSVIINKNGYAVAKNVDLSKGISALTVMARASAGSRLEVRLDKADGESIAMFMVGTEAKELKFNTKASVTGTHDLYFVDVMDGSITLDYWQATAADGTVVTPPVGNGTNPYVKTEAETADTSKFVKAMLAPAGGKSVVIDAGGYIRIDNLDFSDGLASFNVYARSSAPRTKLNVYIDDSLTPIGTVNVGTDMTKATELKVSSNITGNHYIYFEAKDGSVTLDAWQAVGASGTVVTPPVGQTVNPYNKVEAENSNALTNAMLSPNKQSIVINDNGYILVQNIDFSKGLSGFGVYAQTNLPKVKLNVYIDDATEPIGNVSVGIDMTKPVYIKLPAGTNVTGTHYIYLEAKGGSVTLDSWNAMPAGSTPIDQPPVVEPPVYEDINPYNKVEAESIPSASYTNAMLTPSKQAVSIMNGGNVVAKNVVFSKGVSEFKVTAGSSAGGKLEVRLGSATGTLLGSATVSGDAKELTIKSSQNLSGKKDIYFVSANGVISFDSWKVTEYKEPVVTPPVVETGVKASYKENSWNDGYQLNFTVTNSSGKTINSWKVKVKKSDINVSQSWCVNVSQEGDYYVFTPMSYNSTLANGQSTEFGMIGRGQVGSTINYTVE